MQDHIQEIYRNMLGVKDLSPKLIDTYDKVRKFNDRVGTSAQFTLETLAVIAVVAGLNPETPKKEAKKE